MLRASTASLTRTVTASRLKKVMLNSDYIINSSPHVEWHKIINSSPDLPSAHTLQKNILGCPEAIVSGSGLQNSIISGQAATVKSLNSSAVNLCVLPEVESTTDPVEEKIVRYLNQEQTNVNMKTDVVENVSGGLLSEDENFGQSMKPQDEDEESLDENILWRDIEASRSFLYRTAGRSLNSI